MGSVAEAPGERSVPLGPRNVAFSLIGGNSGDGWGELLFSVSASVEHLFQIRIQKHPSGVQLFSDGTELWEGRIHFLKVLPGAAVGLWKQQDTRGLGPWSWDFSRAADRHPVPMCLHV